MEEITTVGIELAKNGFSLNGEQGSIAASDVPKELLGTRSVLEYLLSPVPKVAHEAGRER